MNKQRIFEALDAVKIARNVLTDEQALECPAIYPEWSANSPGYTVGYRVLYEGKLYKVIQDHAPQADWTPAAAPSLFARVLSGQDGTDIGVWEQPSAENPYMKGDRVHFPTMDDPVYESLIDGNIWSPEAYPDGWKIVE